MARFAGWCGIIASVGDAVFPFLVAYWQPGYDHIRQYMSELAATGRPGAALLSYWWIASGALLVLFAIGLGRETQRGALGTSLGPIAIAMYGVFTGIGSGLFPCDEGCVGLTWSGRVHDEVNAVGAMAQLVAPGLIAFRWTQTPRLRIWSLGMQAAMVVSFLGFMVYAESTHGQPNTRAGLWQRLYQGAFYVWLIPLAVHLVRQRHRPCSRIGDGDDSLSAAC